MVVRDELESIIYNHSYNTFKGNMDKDDYAMYMVSRFQYWRKYEPGHYFRKEYDDIINKYKEVK